MFNIKIEYFDDDLHSKSAYYVYYKCDLKKTEAQKSYAHATLNDKTEREQARNSFVSMPHETKRKPLSLEKTTSSVLSVLLSIYAMRKELFFVPLRLGNLSNTYHMLNLCTSVNLTY